ncbi:MAG: hypothetical protein WCF85_15320, partial [Rhodospirillaceae bacterium]
VDGLMSEWVDGMNRISHHQMYFEDRHLNIIDFIDDAFRDDLPVTCGVLGARCAALYFKPGDDVPLPAQGNV